MASPEQVKRKNKYANKLIKTGNLRLNLDENNHIDLENSDSDYYNNASARV